jgi:glutamate synthase domain-containing protein 3
MKAKYSIIIAIAIFSIACKKSDQSISPSQNADVYIAGSVKAQNGYYVAAYWKNGVITKLTDSLSDAFGNNIAVSGTDVYVTGSIDNKGATYWKNGKSVTLSSSGKTFAIAVAGNDVYVAGISTGFCYWKNGVETRLGSEGLAYYASSIQVIGKDVYVSGFTGSAKVYWKNNVAIPFSNNLTAKANAMVVVSR